MNITALQIIDAAVALCEAAPEHVYAGATDKCYYTPVPGIPEGCLFGQALMNLGVTQERLEEFQEEHDGETGIVNLLDWLNIGAEDETLEALGSAQGAQDTGAPWGRAPLSFLLIAKDLES